MPTTYAHDLFGKEVYKRLPSDMKALIRRHGDLYRIGLHGPDILFYYMVSKNPVTQFGIEMHHEKARAFFEEGMRQVRRNDDEALFAYLLGFGCHYILDSACHPYVNKMAAEGVIPHIVLEKEFDRVLMEETGKDPDHYYPACGIMPKIRHGSVGSVKGGFPSGRIWKYQNCIDKRKKCIRGFGQSENRRDPYSCKQCCQL